MRHLGPLTASADPTRDMPADADTRLDRIEAALASLDAEEHRLQRLGLEIPLGRCREQRRYWNFLRGLFGAAAADPAAGSAR